MGRHILVTSSLIFLLCVLIVGQTLADVSAQLKQADTYRKNGQYHQAEQICRDIIRDYPWTTYALKAQKKLVILYILLKKQADAEAALDSLIADFADHPALPRAISNIEAGYYMRILAAESWVRENYLRPVEIWEKVLSKFPDFFYNDPDLYYFIACCYYQLGQYKKAIEYCNLVINNWPDHKYGRRDARYLIDDSLDKLGQSRK